MILNDKMVRIISKKYENSELLHSLKSTDLLLVISVSGFLVNVILPYIKDNQAKTILLTTVHDLNTMIILMRYGILVNQLKQIIEVCIQFLLPNIVSRKSLMHI